MIKEKIIEIIENNAIDYISIKNKAVIGGNIVFKLEGSKEHIVGYTYGLMVFEVKIDDICDFEYEEDELGDKTLMIWI